MGVYLAGLFSLFSPVQIVLFVVLLGGLIALFIWGNTQKNKDSRAEMLQRKYYTLDAEKLAAIPDEELVEAVAANVLAKVDKRRPSMEVTLAQVSHGRCAVTCVFLMCRELDAGSFDEVLEGPTGHLLELAADGYDAVGAPGCAAAVRGVLTAETEEARAELHADYLEKAEEEEPLEKCVAYIRDNPEEFLDEGILGG